VKLVLRFTTVFQGALAMSSLKAIDRVPTEEAGGHMTDAELRKKLNEIIDQLNAQLNEITHLRGQVGTLSGQVTALRLA
jgi:ABC-type phosphate transport system auxiliary subunit